MTEPTQQPDLDAIARDVVERISRAKPLALGVREENTGRPILSTSGGHDDFDDRVGPHLAMKVSYPTDALRWRKIDPHFRLGRSLTRTEAPIACGALPGMHWAAT